jgi:hypothetical protein
MYSQVGMDFHNAAAIVMESVQSFRGNAMDSSLSELKRVISDMASGRQE